MPVIIAAFLLGAIASPPVDDDDDKIPTARPLAAAPKSDDDYEPPKSVRPSAPHDDDAKPKASGAQPVSVRPADADEEGEGQTQRSGTIVVTARRLDAARTQIDAGLGASVYSLTNDTIENRPGGETGKLADILTEAPGVTLLGTVLNVRGSPANQIRINNVIIPEAISDPADLISSRLAETTRLITGTLPAQFGFAPAGIISITTKNGLYQHGGQAELFVGSDGMVEPAFEWAGSAEHTSLFISGEIERDRSTLADAAGNTAHDRRTGVDGLGFTDHVIDDENRVSFIFGGSHEHHRIGATGLGPGSETNDNGYGVATYQHSNGGFTLQTSFFVGIGFDGARFAGRTYERRSSWGTQVDASQSLGTAHALRFGLLAGRSTARELDLEANRSSAGRTSVALYAQDEWKIAPSLTFNPGARVEWLRGLNSAPKVEPRGSFVWESGTGLTAHFGYARFVSAPPIGDDATKSLPDERDDYFDAGIQQKWGSLTLGVDGYWRSVCNYLATHQTPGSAVASAFSFKRARIRGIELSATYARRRTTAWANVSLSRTEARTIMGGEALFGPATLAAASASYLPPASDRPVTASGGLTQHFGRFSLAGDVQVSSGTVRTTSVTVPNGSRHSAYTLFGVAAVYHARIAGKPADLRLDLTNLTNVHYATSDATNLEGGWTRQGRGRAITVGIEQGF